VLSILIILILIVVIRRNPTVGGILGLILNIGVAVWGFSVYNRPGSFSYQVAVLGIRLNGFVFFALMFVWFLFNIYIIVEKSEIKKIAQDRQSETKKGYDAALDQLSSDMTLDEVVSQLISGNTVEETRNVSNLVRVTAKEILAGKSYREIVADLSGLMKPQESVMQYRQAIDMINLIKANIQAAIVKNKVNLRDGETFKHPFPAVKILAPHKFDGKSRVQAGELICLYNNTLIGSEADLQSEIGRTTPAQLVPVNLLYIEPSTKTWMSRQILFPGGSLVLKVETNV
jgi:hypothetical protein